MARCRGARGFLGPPGCEKLGRPLGGIALMLLGLFLIFLCIPFQIWVFLLGAGLIVLGYFLLRF